MRSKPASAALAATLVLGLSACATAPAITPSPLPIAPDYAGYVVERPLILRVSANGGAAAVTQFAAGQPVTARVEAAGDNWYRLTLPDGTAGYIFGLPLRLDRP